MVPILYTVMLLLITGFILSAPVQGGSSIYSGEGLPQQSPIDIQTTQVNPDLGRLKMNYFPAYATLISKGYEIQVAWSGDAGSLEIEGVEYKLKQCHWHHPAEHTINERQYPLELHMVHMTEDDKIAVIGIFYDIRKPPFGKPDYFLEKLGSAIEDITDVTEINLGIVNPNDIQVENDAAYYRYTGSLTTSPFTEGVTWTIIKQVKTVTEEQVNGLRRAINGQDNARPVQPLNGRIVEEYTGDEGIDMVGVEQEHKNIPSFLS